MVVILLSKTVVRTRFWISELDIVIPRNEPTDIETADTAYDAGETPAKTHPKLVHTSESRLILPTALSICRRIMRTSNEESLYESFNRRSGDIEGEGGENERGGEATARLEFVSYDGDETRNLV
jgi:hypothetical protein